MENRQQTPSGKENQHWLIRNMRRNFITGLLVIVPAALVTLALIWFFNTIDSILQPIIAIIFGREIIGLGFGITVVLIYLAGILASNIVGARIIQFGEWFSQPNAGTWPALQRFKAGDYQPFRNVPQQGGFQGSRAGGIPPEGITHHRVYNW